MAARAAQANAGDTLSQSAEPAEAGVAMAINQHDLMGRIMNSALQVTFHVISFTLSLSRAN